MSRKTVSVDYVKERVNTFLSTPNSSLYLKCPGKDRDMTTDESMRMALCGLLESILFETGNYRGFGYQSGQIQFGFDETIVKDETRRIYY